MDAVGVAASSCADSTRLFMLPAQSHAGSAGPRKESPMTARTTFRNVSIGLVAAAVVLLLVLRAVRRILSS